MTSEEIENSLSPPCTECIGTGTESAKRDPWLEIYHVEVQALGGKCAVCLGSGYAKDLQYCSKDHCTSRLMPSEREQGHCHAGVCASD